MMIQRMHGLLKAWPKDLWLLGSVAAALMAYGSAQALLDPHRTLTSEQAELREVLQKAQAVGCSLDRLASVESAWREARADGNVHRREADHIGTIHQQPCPVQRIPMPVLPMARPSSDLLDV